MDGRLGALVSDAVYRDDHDDIAVEASRLVDEWVATLARRGLRRPGGDHAGHAFGYGRFLKDVGPAREGRAFTASLAATDRLGTWLRASARFRPVRP